MGIQGSDRDGLPALPVVRPRDAGSRRAIVCVSQTERSAGLAAKTCTDDQTVVVYNAVDIDAVTVRDHRDGTPSRS